MTNDSLTTTRPAAALAVGSLAVVGTLGSAVMALAHFGIDVPFVGVGRLILPPAIAFTVGTLLYLAVAYGVFRAAPWAWLLGLIVNGVAFISAAFPYRGWVSGVAMTVALLSVVILVTPAGRRAFRGGEAAAQV